jgi:polar amino acid transport system substrate-binding protein
VRGGEVVVALGLEVDVARTLARRLGLRVRFVQVGDAGRLLAPGAKPWDVALAQLTPTSQRATRVDFSSPYVRADQVLLARRGLERPRRLAHLRRLQLCAMRGTRGADVIAGRIRPARRTLLVPDVPMLLRRVQTGVCDVAVAEVGMLGPALAGRRDLFGGISGRIETGAYAFALEKGSALRPAVDGALRHLAADGTLRRLARAWLGVDLPRLPVLR